MSGQKIFPRMTILCVCIFFTVATEVSAASTRPAAEDRLLKQMADGREYNKFVAPTHNGPVDVELEFSLISFDFKDEANDLTTMHIWLSQTWTDTRLQWNPAEYNGTELILLPTENVWLPLVELLSSGSSNHHNTPAVWVDNGGTVTIYTSTSIETVCRLNLRYFPYDKQICTLSFGSWTYWSDVVKLTPYHYDYTHIYKQIGSDFEVNKLDAMAHEYEEQGWEWANAEYSIHLKRISSAYSVKLVLPAVVTGFLILMTFLLPPTSQEKITLAGLILISLVLQLVNLQDLVPASGNTMLGDFLAFAVCLDFFAIVLAVLSYYIHNKSAVKDGNDNQDEEGKKGFSLPLPHCCQQAMSFLRFLDIACFVVFLIVFIIGIAAIMGQRG